MDEKKSLSDEIIRKIDQGLNVEYYNTAPNREQLIEQNRKTLEAINSNPGILNQIVEKAKEYGKQQCKDWQMITNDENIQAFIDYTRARTIAVEYCKELLQNNELNGPTR